MNGDDHDKQNDADIAAMRAKPDVKPISADAAEACMDVIYAELGKALLWHNELGQIRATLIANFGRGTKHPLLADQHVDVLPAETLMRAVLTRLVKDREDLRVMHEIAARIPSKDWLKARESAGFGIQVVPLSKQASA